MATATATAERSHTRLDSIRNGDIMCITHFVKVEETPTRDIDYGNTHKLQVRDLDRDETFHVIGDELIEECSSADRFHTTKKTTKTKIAEKLVSSFNIPFTVNFDKDNGDNRTLRGRLIKPEPLMGRSQVEDLDQSADSHRLRQVNHRSIHWLIVDGVKYTTR